jgi:S-DNA-T family DNA segregation ATPase FtsK/SpoIIIE
VKSFCSSPLEFSKLLTEIKKESDRRLKLFDAAGVVNIRSYKKKLPYILVVIDEFACLCEQKPILEALKQRVAQDRKCGIHYIVCTQRPDTSVVNGTLKANIPTRIALKVSTETDSRVILDEGGASELRGRGHAILKTDRCREFQAMYLSETQAYKLVESTFTEKEVKKHAAKRLPTSTPY